VLRSLQESRRRREEQLAAANASANEPQGLPPHFSSAGTTVTTDAAASGERSAPASMAGNLVGGSLLRGDAASGLLPAADSQSVRGTVRWEAVSSNVQLATPCRHCCVVIPPRFLRMQRTQMESSFQSFYHANYDCLRSVHHEIRVAPTIHGRGLHPSTSQLNLSAFHGIGGARRGCVAHVKGVFGVCMVFLCV
jgi:hypothetical protein